MSVRHDAVLYEGLDGFVELTAPFVNDGIADGGSVAVMAPPDRLEALRRAIGAGAEQVRLVDMTIAGRNPARIIPAWREIIDAARAEGRPLWGVGEPIWAGRSEDELAEAIRHEALLDLALADAGGEGQLLCPYDGTALAADLLDAAHRTHRHVVADGDRRPSEAFEGVDTAVPFAAPLPAAPEGARTITYEATSLAAVRHLVARAAEEAGLEDDRVHEVVLVGSEVASNAVEHGGRLGVARQWRSDDWLVVEIEGGSLIADPLVGRTRPGDLAEGGRGLWLANRLCDLVRIHSTPARTLVRLQLRLA